VAHANFWTTVPMDRHTPRMAGLAEDEHQINIRTEILHFLFMVGQSLTVYRNDIIRDTISCVATKWKVNMLLQYYYIYFIVKVTISVTIDLCITETWSNVASPRRALQSLKCLCHGNAPGAHCRLRWC